MAIRFTEQLKFNDSNIYLYCKEVKGQLEGVNFDINIQGTKSFELKMCRIHEGRWINVTQNIPDWVDDIVLLIVDVVEGKLRSIEGKSNK